MEWQHSGSPCPTPKTSECKNPQEKLSPQSFGIKTASSSLIIFIVGQPINTEYYSSLLVHLKDILKEKHHTTGRSPRGVLFFHDSALAHQALAAQKKLAYLSFHCLNHPPYSPDLVPLDYHLFPGLKKQLKGRHLSSNTEVIATVGTCLDGQPSEFFFSDLQKLEQWAKKCIELRREYVE